MAQFWVTVHKYFVWKHFKFDVSIIIIIASLHMWLIVLKQQWNLNCTVPSLSMNLKNKISFVLAMSVVIFILVISCVKFLLNR